MIYLSGSCSSEQRTLMTSIARFLRLHNEEVYCPFELSIPDAWSYSQEDWSKKVFEADIEALDKCDTVLVISPGRMSSAGTNFEQGYAYAKNKKIVVVQFTRCPTSLMTYVGSTLFINTNQDNILVDIEKVLYDESEKRNCETTLT